MTREDIQLLYEYDRWANGRVLGAAETLDPEQFTRDLGGSFKSVRDTLVHIIGGEWIWLQYWNEPVPSFAFLAAVRSRRDALFAPGLVPDIGDTKKMWAEVENVQVEFVNGLSDESLRRMLPFRATEVPLAHMMRQLGAEPVATDFHVFLVEGRR
jgi:DinB family